MSDWAVSLDNLVKTFGSFVAVIPLENDSNSDFRAGRCVCSVASPWARFLRSAATYSVVVILGREFSSAVETWEVLTRVLLLWESCIWLEPEIKSPA